MEIYNKYIITLATLLLVTTVAFVAIGVDSLDLYYLSYVIETLIVTETFVYLNPKARRGLNVVAFVMSVVFWIIVVQIVL